MLSQGFRITPVHFSTDYITNTSFLYYFFLFTFFVSQCYTAFTSDPVGDEVVENGWMDATLLCRILLNLKLLTVSQPVHPKCVFVWLNRWLITLSGHWPGVHCCSTPGGCIVFVVFLKQTRSTFSAALVVVGGRNFSKVAVNRGNLGNFSQRRSGLIKRHLEIGADMKT